MWFQLQANCWATPTDRSFMHELYFSPTLPFAMIMDILYNCAILWLMNNTPSSIFYAMGMFACFSLAMSLDSREQCHPL